MICANSKKFCCEDISQIENYSLAKNDLSKTWHCHHRLETEVGYTVKELKELNLYYNRPANELIYLLPKDHVQLHKDYNKSVGQKSSWKYTLYHTEEYKQRMSAERKGNPKYKHKESTKRQMSISAIGKHKGEKHVKYMKICPLVLYSQYIVLNKSVQDCAELFNCSAALIYKRLKEYSLSLDKNYKYSWRTPNGNIIQMDIRNAKRYHPDWVLVA